MVGWIYAGGGVISWVFVYFCIPEVSWSGRVPYNQGLQYGSSPFGQAAYGS